MLEDPSGEGNYHSGIVSVNQPQSGKGNPAMFIFSQCYQHVVPLQLSLHIMMKDNYGSLRWQKMGSTRFSRPEADPQGYLLIPDFDKEFPVQLSRFDITPAG